MKLSTPEEMDGIDDEMTPAAAGYGRVSLFGQEMEFGEAVRVMADVVSSPEDFALVSDDRVAELEGRISELEEMNESLRRDLAVVWASLATEAVGGEWVIPDGEGMGVVPESVDEYDPAGEFE